MNVFITGAAQGIGSVIARAFCEAGDAVAVADIQADRAASVATHLGASAIAVELDVRDPSAWDRAWRKATSELGSIDVLVNNAAKTVTRSIWNVPLDEWDDVLAINLRGTLIGCRLAGQDMRSRGSGRIINMASIAGQQGGSVGGPHYAASKAGIIVLTKIVARELAPYQITCNAIAPAAIDGPIAQSLSDEQRRSLLARIPLNRLGQPEEVASLVRWLASSEAGFVTGATFDINGGLLTR